DKGGVLLRAAAVLANAADRGRRPVAATNVSPEADTSYRVRCASSHPHLRRRWQSAPHAWGTHSRFYGPARPGQPGRKASDVDAAANGDTNAHAAPRFQPAAVLQRGR